LSGSSNSNSTSPKSNDPSGSGKNKSNTGAIAGGVVGTIAFLTLFGIGAIYFIRRRRQQQQQLFSQPPLEAHADEAGKRGGSESDLLDSSEVYEIQDSTVPAYEKHAPGAALELPAFTDNDSAKQHWNTPPTELIELDGTEARRSEDHAQH
jgi:hypothetical protein